MARVAGSPIGLLLILTYATSDGEVVPPPTSTTWVETPDTTTVWTKVNDN